METFTQEALLSAAWVAIIAVLVIPLAFALRKKAQAEPECRGAPERWQGWLMLGLVLLTFSLPGVLSQFGIKLGLFDFLRFDLPANTPLRPKIHIATEREWSALTQSIQQNYAALVALPLILGSTWWLQRDGRLVGTRPRPNGAWLRTLGSVVFCWATFGLAAFALNFVLQFVYLANGLAPVQHPIARIGLNDGLGGWLIGLGACVCAPVFEELIFRRWMLPWARRRQLRPLGLQAVMVLLAAMAFEQSRRVEVLAFGAFLVIVQLLTLNRSPWLRRKFRRIGSRAFAANWATSSVFAMLHASVWPTPVALLVLSLGLGFLAIRTGRWWAAALCHSLFNFTSLMVLFTAQGLFGPQFQVAVAP